MENRKLYLLLAKEDAHHEKLDLFSNTHSFLRQTHYHVVLSFNLAEVFSQTFTKSLKLSKISMPINLHPNVSTSRKKNLDSII